MAGKGTLGLGEFFEMTIGDLDNDYEKYRKRGVAYIPLSEIAGYPNQI